MADQTDNAHDHPESPEEAGDEARRKYKYRKLVMMRGVKMPARLAMKLVGPDCAYHLYRHHMPAQTKKPTKGK